MELAQNCHTDVTLPNFHDSVMPSDPWSRCLIVVIKGWYSVSTGLGPSPSHETIAATQFKLPRATLKTFELYPRRRY